MDVVKFTTGDIVTPVRVIDRVPESYDMPGLLFGVVLDARLLQSPFDCYVRVDVRWFNWESVNWACSHASWEQIYLRHATLNEITMCALAGYTSEPTCNA